MTLCDFCGKEADILKLEVWTVGADPEYKKDLGDMCDGCQNKLIKQQIDVEKKFKRLEHTLEEG